MINRFSCLSSQVKHTKKQGKFTLFQLNKIDNLMKSVDQIDLNKTLHNLLNDCNRKIHFSQKFVNEISFQFNGQLISILNSFNRNFEKEFRQRISVDNFNLQFQFMQKLSQFTQLNQRNFLEINFILNQILQKDFYLSNQFLIESLEQVIECFQQFLV